MILLLLKPESDLSEREADEDEPVHIIVDGPLGDPDADYWTMHCGLVVRAFDDGTLLPKIDFYDGKNGQRASCQECLRRWREHA